MPRPETGSFNRLITSLGMLLVAAAFVVPYFFYRSTDVLEIPRSELNDLTSTARDAIEARQRHVSDLQPYILPLSGVLIFGGAGFLAWGAFRLRDVQDRDDREADARVATAEAGLRELTPKEKEEKLIEEVRVSDDEPRQATASRPRTPNDPARKEARKWHLEASRAIERATLDTLAAEEFEGYRFRSQVAVGGLRLDGLFLSEEKERPDVLLEVKVATNLRLPREQERIRSLVEKYEEERKRHCRGWFVVVLTALPDDAEPRNIGDLAYRLNRSLDPLGVATVIREDEIPRLPRAFVKAFSE